MKNTVKYKDRSSLREKRIGTCGHLIERDSLAVTPDGNRDHRRHDAGSEAERDEAELPVQKLATGRNESGLHEQQAEPCCHHRGMDVHDEWRKGMAPLKIAADLGAKPTMATAAKSDAMNT